MTMIPVFSGVSQKAGLIDDEEGMIGLTPNLLTETHDSSSPCPSVSCGDNFRD